MARNPHASYEASDHQRMPIIPIANNVTTTTPGYALDARQGKALNDKIDNTFPSYYCEAYYSASPGANVTVTDVLKFNLTYNNVGNCYNTSTGYFTCPVNGLYTASFTFFSNSTAVNQRPCLYFGGKQIMTNGPYGHTLCGTCYCSAGTRIYVKPQNTTYAFSFFGYSGHNLFTVALLRRI